LEQDQVDAGVYHLVNWKNAEWNIEIFIYRVFYDLWTLLQEVIS